MTTTPVKNVKGTAITTPSAEEISSAFSGTGTREFQDAVVAPASTVSIHALI